MSAIDEYICELLYEHDCVIVPSLGGFLASNVQAKLNPAQHTILPPRRKIAFNIYLRQNDGLLANHLVEFERISYPDAIKRIEEYVQNCFTKLEQHRKVIVERVGTIYYDKEKHLLFEPFREIQFRKDAYGLSSVQFLPVDRDDTTHRIEKQKKELSKLRPSAKSGRKVFGILRSHYKILGLVAIAGTLLWFSINLFLIKPNGGYLGSLTPFTPDTGIRLNENRTDTEHKTVTVPVPVETVFVASTEPLMPEPGVHKAESLAVASAETKKFTEPELISDANYHVIAGVFKIAENAENHLKNLQNQGFVNTRIIRKGSLHYVSYDSFTGRKAALSMLDSLRKQQTEGWIWHN